MTNENIHNISTSRRDFLKFLGFSTAVAALAGCEGAVHKTIPYVIQPESIVAGEANYCIAQSRSQSRRGSECKDIGIGIESIRRK